MGIGSPERWGVGVAVRCSGSERDQFPRDDASVLTAEVPAQSVPNLTGSLFCRRALIVPDGAVRGVMLALLAAGEGETVTGERDAGGTVQGLSRA
tara:strand:+ start:205 stop:489 length:285 start_codon:yes stop_codon:yes gene_type:complete